ncbi:MAG TPA: FAD-dependent oxidoreductase, partial [Anaerolineae bacterium]|nr:FAD-dependent oxidoreductase [Anaerolineae bacterium]
MNDISIGVFLCDCGDQLASLLDLDALERGARDLPGVTTVRRLGYSCLPEGLAAIQAAVAEEGLNRVLVAGCTPRTLERRFQAACKEAGLDDGMFELADIREGCAWVHQDQPQLVTAKALDLIWMGAARVALRQARHPVSAEVTPAALVIGGGIAGMTAALTLANAGQPVKLVERGPALGGMLRDAFTLYPDRRSAADFVAQKVGAVTHHPRVEVLLKSQVTDVSGTVGRYTVSVNGAGRRFDVGAIIVATGAHALQPWGLFRYDGHRIVTQLEFERELRDMEANTRSVGLPASNVIMILCAGQHNGATPYCSGVCCLGAVKQAIEIKEADPRANATILFRDLNLLGKDICEERLFEARRAGVEFIRYRPSSPPKV